ncbi:hypothetical protein BDZ94DRAFT_406238 [Collybia nuda]|uniref:Uncharacterized protein n=1 Tax=Collybia nuda TaxID=64659 RepID=A0A9P5YC21_9AGAR|nr:hypothetical protein BDZ94DRAFT_406238 [Collybia nuda]
MKGRFTTRLISVDRLSGPILWVGHERIVGLICNAPTNLLEGSGDDILAMWQNSANSGAVYRGPPVHLVGRPRGYWRLSPYIFLFQKRTSDAPHINDEDIVFVHTWRRKVQSTSHGKRNTGSCDLSLYLTWCDNAYGNPSWGKDHRIRRSFKRGIRDLWPTHPTIGWWPKSSLKSIIVLIQADAIQ